MSKQSPTPREGQSTVHDAVRTAMDLRPDGDFWKNYLSESLRSAHIKNALTSNDYLDDMSWAERRRSNGFAPIDRARLDMPASAIIGDFT